MGLFQKKEEKEAAQLPPPRHIAIIMDGNGRWAKKRGLPRTAGHAAGAESFRRIANYCRTLGVRYLTVYAFSTENWKRSQEEIGGIMSLLRRYLEEALRDMEKNQVHFVFFGDLSKLSPELRTLCRNAEARSAAYHEVQVYRPPGALPRRFPKEKSGRRSWMKRCFLNIYILQTCRTRS